MLRIPWTQIQPNYPVQIDWSNPLTANLQRCFSAVHGVLDPSKGRAWDTVNSVVGNSTRNVSGVHMLDNNRGNYVSSLQSTPAAGWTIACVYVAISGTSGSPRAGFCESPGSSSNDRAFTTGGGASHAYKAYLFDGAQRNSGGLGSAINAEKVHLVARCTPSFSLGLCLNGLWDTPFACGNNGFTYTSPEFCVGNASNSNVASEGFALCLYLDRAWSDSEAQSWCARPWQIFVPTWLPLLVNTSAASGVTGGGSDTLRPLQEAATGIVGVVSRSGTETLQPLQEQATGRVGAVVRAATETLQPLQTKATGLAGVLGFATDTLRPLQTSGGGSVTSNNVTGGGSETLQPLQERATGIIGVLAGAADTLRPLQTKATGIVGVVGFAADALQPLQTAATGFTPTQLAPAITTQGGATAWWGYEGFDGTRRPWWYKDLKDKAKELQRIRKQRIEIGLLPPDETELADTAEEVLEFAEEIPTPALADYYVHRQEVLAAKIEALIDDIEEKADEEDISRLSKFFFHRKERSQWLTH
jgi:hypothetical protein